MAKQITKGKALKDNLRTFIVIEALAVIFFVVGFIIPAIQIIAILFAVSFVLGGFIAFSAGKKCINRSFCPKCSAKYDYERDISWEEIEREEKTNKIVAKVEFRCVCPECKQQNEFVQPFTILYYDKQKNTWKQNNLRTMARKYFWK